VNCKGERLQKTKKLSKPETGTQQCVSITLGGVKKHIQSEGSNREDSNHTRKPSTLEQNIGLKKEDGRPKKRGKMRKTK